MYVKRLHLISVRKRRTEQSNLQHLAGSHIPFGGLLGTFHLLWSSALKIDRNKKRSSMDRPKIFFLVCRICDPQRECLGFTRQSGGRGTKAVKICAFWLWLVKNTTIASQSEVYPIFLLIIRNCYMPFPPLNVSVRSRETVGTKEVPLDLKVSHVASQVCVSKFMVKRRKERKVVSYWGKGGRT